MPQVRSEGLAKQSLVTCSGPFDAHSVSWVSSDSPKQLLKSKAVRTNDIYYFACPEAVLCILRAGNNSCGYSSLCFQVSAASSKPPTKNNIMNNFFGKAAMSKCFTVFRGHHGQGTACCSLKKNQTKKPPDLRVILRVIWSLFFFFFNYTLFKLGRN